MALEDGEPLYGTALEMVPIEGPIPEGAFQMPNRAAYFTSKQVELDKRVVEKVFDSVSPSQAKTLEDRNWSSGKNTVGRVGRLFNEAYNFVQGRPSKIRKLMEQGDLYKNIEPEIVDAMIDEINPERISTSYADLGLGKLNLGSL
jgi:hypothetical protein